MGGSGGVDDLQQRVNDSMANVQRVQERLNELRGIGTSDDGLIQATVAANGDVLDLDLNPRVMRLDTYTLKDSILQAIHLARADLQQRMADESNDLQAEIGGFLSASGLQGELTRLSEGFSRDMGDMTRNFALLQEKLRKI